MSQPEPAHHHAGELHILVGGFLEECIGEVIAKMIEKHLGYSRVNVRIIEALPAFLETAAQTPPDLFLLYLYFGTPADDAVTDLAVCQEEIQALLADAAHQPCYVTSCGLRLVTHMHAEFSKPVIVLTGCADAPGRATRVEQAGGSALLLLPFTAAECVAAIGSCVERPSDART